MAGTKQLTQKSTLSLKMPTLPEKQVNEDALSECSDVVAKSTISSLNDPVCRASFDDDEPPRTHESGFASEADEPDVEPDFAEKAEDAGETGPADAVLQTGWNISLTHKNKKDPNMPEGRVSYPGLITTIYGFWRAVHNLPLPTELMIRHRQELAMFREHIQPEWESPENENGGYFRIPFDSTLYMDRREARNCMNLNVVWMELLMAMVGEQIPHAEYITGCGFKRRQAEDRLEIWTTDMSRCEEKKEEMHRFLAQMLQKFGQIEYMTHEDNKSFLAQFNAKGKSQSVDTGRGMGRSKSDRRNSRW